ncbi:MAG: hypothetical protein GDA68_02890 [Nitrospira sp. CR2.1]|nr:hypothetical protein [Nitrospira sp. CR2.1]
MAVPTKVQHPLLWSPGTSQRKRIADALSLRHDSAQIDGRKLGDLFDSIYQYGRLVVFHEHKINPEGRAYVELSNWLSFFEGSLPFTLNRFAKLDFDQLEADLRGYLSAIENKPNAESLRLLLDLYRFELIAPWDRLLQRSTREWDRLRQSARQREGLQRSAHQLYFKLVTLLERTTRTSLLPSLRRFINLSNAAAKYFGTGRYEFAAFAKAPWDIPREDLFVVDETVVDIPGGRDGAILWLGIEAADTAQRLLVAQREIAVEIPRFLNSSIEVLEGQNEPHLGLLLAFLRLFEHFQGDLNALTQKHLEFFYFQVLKLKPRNMKPDQAHLVFETGKHLLSHEIAHGAQFKGPKDNNNIDILFGLDEEIVIDTAKVAALKTLFLNSSQGCLDANTEAPRSFVEGVYIAPVANSADGEGEPFQEVQSKNWATLGAKASKYTAPGKGAPQIHPFGRSGFVLASPVLWLNEGRRTVTITIECDAEGNQDIFTKCFQTVSQIKDLFDVRFSGEDGWFKAERGVTVKIEPKDRKYLTLTFVSTLGSDEPAVAFYEEKAIDEFLATTCPLPMVKIELNPDVQARCKSSCKPDDCCLAKQDRADTVGIALYHFLRCLRIKNVKIDVKVCGVKNLVVQNEESLQDVNSPLLPFGARPKVGAEFYIGSKEVFCKNWQKFWLHVNWKDKPSKLKEHYEFYNNDEPFEDGSSEIQDDSFTFKAAVLGDGSWHERVPSALAPLENAQKDPRILIFADSPDINEDNLCGRTIDPNDSSYYKKFLKNEFGGLKYEPKSLKPGPLEPLSVNANKGFFRMTLQGVSFQHDRYAFALARKLFKLSQGLDPVSLGKMRANLKAAKDTHGGIQQKIADIKTKAEELDGINQLADIDQQAELNELIGNVDDIIKDLNEPTGAEQLMKNLHAALKNLDDALKVTDAHVGLPREPYTPLIKALEVDYCASADITDIEIIHLYPFPKTSKAEVLKEHETTLLPTFTEEGTLFIGLTELRPRSILHLLFQFAEATADSESDRATIAWHYLAKNEWRPLRPGFEVLSDATDQLTRSGIVKIAVPEDIFNEETTVMPRTTVMPPKTKDDHHLFWLKVSAERAVAGVAELVGVHAQAALATYGPLADSDPMRVAAPLAPKQIAKTLQPDSGVKKVEQPYESFGGRVAEVAGTIPVRMSEQLRHKRRSVDAFDIEHLVLEEFPELYKCKCISHSMGLSANTYRRDLEVAPGFLIVAVVPDLAKLRAGDMLEPKAPVSTLTKVKKFLKERVSPFARFRVMNPRYEKIMMKVTVRLRPGRDENFYRLQLETDLVHFLAPWHLGDTDKVSFGQHVVYSDVVGFIKGLKYIEHVIDLRMFDSQSSTRYDMVDDTGLQEIVPLTARSILTGGKIEVNIDRKKCGEAPTQPPDDISSATVFRKAAPISCGVAQPYWASCKGTTDPDRAV